MTQASASDEQLLAALGRRDVGALEALYERYKTVAYSLAYRIVGERSAAEDVVQDAFLAVWRRAASFQASRGKVRSWLLAIVHHRAVDRLRSAAKPAGDVPLDDIRDLESSAPPIWQEVWERQQGDAVRTALETLPPDQKKSVELAYFSGYTHVEIAQLMGVPLGTVKGRLRIGLQKLKSQLEGRRLGVTGT